MTKINWESVRKKLDYLLENNNNDASAESYRTFYAAGTSAILPPSEQANNKR